MVIRPYRGPADDPGLAEMRAAAGWPERFDCLIAEDDDGAVAGCGWLDWWDEADGTRLYLLSGGIAPARRGRGLGRALLSQQEAEAAQLWERDPGSGPALLGANAGPDQPSALALLTAAGYRVRFTIVDLACDPAEAGKSPEATDPAPGDNTAEATDPAEGGAPPADEVAGVRIRPVEENHHPAIYAAVTTCFADSRLGQVERTYAEYLEEAKNPDLWLVAWDDDGIAAVVINEVLGDGVVDTPWVAVLPRRRRQGLASALLRRNFALLATNGIREARIRTVQENPNKTVSLYERLGYRITGRLPRYAKPLPFALSAAGPDPTGPDHP